MKKSRKALFYVTCIILIFHVVLFLIKGTIISTFLLTISIYVLALFTLLKLRSKLKLNANFDLSFIILILLLLSVESYLRYGDGKYLNYTENNGSSTYYSNYKFHNLYNNYKPNYNPNSKSKSAKKEFDYSYTYNNIGFRGDDIEAVKGKNEVRILALGDSFTEGIGAPDDSTWVKSVDFKLNHLGKDKTFNVMNAGKSGSDPVYSLQYFKDNVGVLQPDIVVLAINSSDVEDIIQRGGNDRFDKKGELRLRKGPWWEFFYSYSFIVRHLVHDRLQYTRTLIRESKVKEEYTYAINEILKSTMDFQKLCDQKNIGFMIVFGVHEHEMNNKELSGNLDVVYKYLIKSTSVNAVYIPKCFIEELKETGNSIDNYYWKIDRHHNSKGYNLFANCVTDAILFDFIIGNY